MTSIIPKDISAVGDTTITIEMIRSRKKYISIVFHKDCNLALSREAAGNTDGVHFNKGRTTPGAARLMILNVEAYKHYRMEYEYLFRLAKATVDPFENVKFCGCVKRRKRGKRKK